MLQLVYVSTVRRGLAPDLDQILRISRANNRRDRISGLLHFDGKRFLQALEGPDAAVEAAFARIEADPRHFAVVTLSRRAVDSCEFGDWAMANRGAGEGRDDFTAHVEALVANASPNVRATFESFVRLRAA